MGSWTEDAGYQKRLQEVAREPGMDKVLSFLDSVAASFSDACGSVGIVSAKAAIVAAKAKANAYAKERGFDAPYPEFQ
jgi:hypothetical protein